jgi:hypothetical protein
MELQSSSIQNIPILGYHREQGCDFAVDDKLEGVQKEHLPLQLLDSEDLKGLQI